MVWELYALCESLLYIESYSMSHLYCCCAHALASLASNAIELDPKYLKVSSVGTSANDVPMSLINELKTLESMRFQLGLAVQIKHTTICLHYSTIYNESEKLTRISLHEDQTNTQKILIGYEYEFLHQSLAFDSRPPKRC